MNNKKKHRIVKILFGSLLFVGGAAAALSQAKAVESNDPSSLVIETDLYCAFLNHEASGDYHDLFNDQMTGHASSAFLQRSGVPGSYHYEAIPGQEKIALPYLSKIAVAQYSTWREQGILNDILTSFSADISEIDPVLKSNSLFFPLALQQASGPAASSNGGFWEDLSWQGKAAAGVAGILLVVGGTTVVNHFRNERALERQRETYEGELRQQQTAWGRLIDTLKREHRNELARQRQRHQDESDDLKQEHQLTLQRQAADFHAALARQQIEHDRKLSDLLKRKEASNQVYYSEKKVPVMSDAWDEEGNSIKETKELPAIGYFQAGTQLLNELGEEVMDAMYEATIEKQNGNLIAGKDENLIADQNGILNQFRKDLPRSTSVTLKENGDSICLAGSSFSGDEKEQKIGEAIAHLHAFLKGTHLFEVIGGIMNQTLATVCTNLYAQAPRISLRKTGTIANFFTEGAYGFPCPSGQTWDGFCGELIYELEKIDGEENPTLLLTFTNATEFQGFYFKDGGGSSSSLVPISFC